MFMLVYSYLTMPFVAFSQDANEANEPTIKGPGTIDLIAGTLDAWKVPSDRWYVDEETIVGHTEGKKLSTPEWLYTKQRFSDFEFTCELKLTGDDHRNTGIYYRANIILFQGHQNNNGRKNDNWKPFEAPSGYEFDAAFHDPTRKNFWGSLGDWYVRPSLRIYPDPAIIDQVYQPGEWNRMTIRARGNRLEYWINGLKVMDYLDHNPQGSREGIIGFQIHNGSVMKIEYRNIRVLPLVL
jgi:hypothetical protein